MCPSRAGEWVIKMFRLWPDQALPAFGISNPQSQISNSPSPDPYDELFKNLRSIIASRQSQLIGQAEEVLARLADTVGT